MFSRQFSNLSHNHEIPSDLMTVIDGRSSVNFEHHLTSAEFVSIQDQCRCRVSVPQLRVNLEESFPYRTFSATMLHRIRDKVLKDKYGDNLHNLHDLFMKGVRIRFYGGKFIVVPSANDFCIATIHCQTKLMGEYANIYGTDGFRMSDGTH